MPSDSSDLGERESERETPTEALHVGDSVLAESPRDFLWYRALVELVDKEQRLVTVTLSDREQTRITIDSELVYTLTTSAKPINKQE